MKEETGHMFKQKASDVIQFYSTSNLVKNHWCISLLYFPNILVPHLCFMQSACLRVTLHNSFHNLANESRLISRRVLSRLQVFSALICFSLLDSGTNQTTVFLSAPN